jgi:AcrR family transcriptional regulator
MTSVLIPDLKIVPREGSYGPGQDGLEQILRAALAILIEQGHSALSLRKIAARCDLKLGNLTYYFPTKQKLIDELLEAVIGSYEAAYDVSVIQDSSAEEQLQAYIELVLDDITTKNTTRLFPELWALSNFDSVVQTRLEEFYRRGRAPLNALIGKLNLDLSTGECEILGLFMSASMEGQTIFAGFEKPWVAHMPTLKKIAFESFLHLIKSAKPGSTF